MYLTIVSRKVGRLDRENNLRYIAESMVADEKATYEQLIAAVESQMMRTIWRIVRHPEVAEDTLQDALTIIWKKLNRIRNHPNPQAFILKICLNCAIDSLRKRKRHRYQENSSMLDEIPSLAQEEVPQALEQKKMEEEILNAISRLSRKQGLAVLMRIVQDQSYDVIAQTLGCSEITARAHVLRGRTRLTQWLSHLQPKPSKEASP